MKKVIFPLILAILAVPMFISAETSPSVVAEPCLIQIFTTNFALPPEGGQIVQVGDRLYFDRTYLPGCAGAGANPEATVGGQDAGATMPAAATLPSSSMPVTAA